MGNIRKMISIIEVQFRRYQAHILGSPETQVKEKGKELTNINRKKKIPELRTRFYIFKGLNEA